MNCWSEIPKADIMESVIRFSSYEAKILLGWPFYLESRIKYFLDSDKESDSDGE